MKIQLLSTQPHADGMLGETFVESLSAAAFSWRTEEDGDLF